MLNACAEAHAFAPLRFAHAVEMWYFGSLASRSPTLQAGSSTGTTSYTTLPSSNPSMDYVTFDHFLTLTFTHTSIPISKSTPTPHLVSPSYSQHHHLNGFSNAHTILIKLPLNLCSMPLRCTLIAPDAHSILL